MDLIRTTLLTPDAIRQMVTLLNEDIRLRAEQRGPDLDRARAQVRKLEQQDANLRRALRTAGPRAGERITLEIETVSAELAAATTRLDDLQLTERPLRVTKRMVDDTIAQFERILERAPLETRVATVRDLFERVDVDSRELKAVAVWNMTTDQGANRSDAVSEWLRRAGPARLLICRCESIASLSLPAPSSDRGWLARKQMFCGRCGQPVVRRSPSQRYCMACRTTVKRERSRESMRRRRLAWVDGKRGARVGHLGCSPPRPRPGANTRCNGL